MQRLAALAPLASCLLFGCADGGTLSPRDRKPPLAAADAGAPPADAGPSDAGQPPPPPPPPPPPRDAGLPSLDFDAGDRLPQPIDAGPRPDAGGLPDAGPMTPEPGCSLPPEGACDGTIAIWCGSEGVEAFDCAEDGLECGYDPASGHGCLEPEPPIDDPCDGIDYLGDCQGRLVRWCDGTALNYRDCGAEDLRCAWVDAETGYWCVP